MAAHVEDAVHRGLVADLALLCPRVLAAAAAEEIKYYYSVLFSPADDPSDSQSQRRPLLGPSPG